VNTGGKRGTGTPRALRMLVTAFVLFATFLSCAWAAPASTLLKSDFQLGGQWRVNSTARLLAGLAPWYPGHYAFAQTDAWREHSALMQAAWSQLRAGRVAAIGAWRNEQIPANCAGNKTLLYPFSGPDFFNAFWLFPDCDNYVMFGLEHIGDVPDVDAMSERDFNRLLLDVRSATADVFMRNYFITENMTRQLHTPQLRGVVPLITISMALSGAEILRMTPQGLGRSSSAASPGAPSPESPKLVSLRKPRGIAIDFRVPGSPAVKRLIYYSVDVTDASMGKYPEFLAYLRKFEPSTMLLKSASYLLHSHDFSRLRQTLLDVSGFLVQDDSGLPYRMLVTQGWQVRLHGSYAVPIPPFERAFQPALHAAYQVEHPDSLPFAFGYSFQDQRDDRANMMIGRKVAVASAPRSVAALGTSMRNSMPGARLKYSAMQAR